LYIKIGCKLVAGVGRTHHWSVADSSCR